MEKKKVSKKSGARDEEERGKALRAHEAQTSKVSFQQAS